MKKIFSCRRSSLALISIITLFILGYNKGMDVSQAIAAMVVAVAGANSYQGKRDA